MEIDTQTSEVVVISMNPNSGATDRRAVVEKLMACLTEQNFEVLLLTDINEVVEVVGQLFGGRLRCVVAAGGDGTISLLANQLPENTPLAILPLGTENLLAKYLGVSGAGSMRMWSADCITNALGIFDIGRTRNRW